MATLVGLTYSPWTEKARWALDHQRVPYRFVEYLPLVGEAALRLASRRFRGKVTVPMLLDGAEVHDDSYTIARYAARHGRSPEPGGLFPAALDDEVSAWNARSDAMMAAGRALLLRRMAHDPLALQEAVPAPRALRSRLEPVARLGTWYLTSKYAIADRDEALDDRTLREGVKALTEALSRGDHLAGDGFTFADLAMCTAMQFVLPVDDRYIPLGPATRRCWTYSHLADEATAALAWRDRVYTRYRALR
ncbi:MAG: glutathione S-transferase [Deltaproteobacteria bacterium]|nr:glutathione S-transferase [Deltaproteobacteria bacterium]